MSKTGKKHKKVKETLQSAQVENSKQALEFVVKNAHVKFDESVDVDVVLGIDAS